MGEGSLFYALQNREQVKRLVADEEIAYAVDNPPATRAQGRSLYIRTLAERGMRVPSTEQPWTTLPARGLNKPPLQTPDPFKAYTDEVEELLKQ
ncbi:MAG: proteasome accessory factor PafA2 family protein [Candidatus Aenigmarchaeota archaeon]|nr:proteasome accessory factor PafA2 family protein [Candidatus Aenigmarchaeota archaeon]